MKKAPKILFTIMATFCVFCALVYSSCKKDSCNGTVCENGGSCSQGMCACPTGYSGSHCEQSTIVYINNTYTPVTITVNEEIHTLAARGGYVSYIGNAGSATPVRAYTSFTNAAGATVGETVNWAFTDNFPTGGASHTVQINIPPTYFYLRMANADNYAKSVNYIKVNYGNQYQVTDSVDLPNNGQIYTIGYFKAMPNTQVYAVDTDGSNWTLNTQIDSLNATATVVIP